MACSRFLNPLGVTRVNFGDHLFSNGLSGESSLGILLRLIQEKGETAMNLASNLFKILSGILSQTSSFSAVSRIVDITSLAFALKNLIQSSTSWIGLLGNLSIFCTVLKSFVLGLFEGPLLDKINSHLEALNSRLSDHSSSFLFDTVRKFCTKCKNQISSLFGFGDSAHNLLSAISTSTANFVTFAGKILLLVVGVLFAPILGIDVSKFVNRLSVSWKAYDHVEEVICDFLYATFGWDPSTRGTFRDQIQRFEQEGHALDTTEAAQVDAVLLDRARKWHSSVSTLLRTLPSRSPVGLLPGLIVRISDKMTSWADIVRGQRSRPVPSALYLHGLPAVGKTWAVNNYFHARFKKFWKLDPSEGLFNLAGNGRFYGHYTLERCGFFEDFGKDLTSVGTNLREKQGNLITILSGESTELEGASVELKSQTPEFLGVLVTSNRELGSVARETVQKDCVDAFRSRFMEFQVVDPRVNANGTQGRLGYTHRRPDLSHLSFIAGFTNDRMGIQRGATYSAEQVWGFWRDDMIYNIESFKAIQDNPRVFPEDAVQAPDLTGLFSKNAPSPMQSVPLSGSAGDQAHSIWDVFGLYYPKQQKETERIYASVDGDMTLEAFETSLVETFGSSTRTPTELAEWRKVVTWYLGSHDEFFSADLPNLCVRDLTTGTRLFSIYDQRACRTPTENEEDTNETRVDYTVTDDCVIAKINNVEVLFTYPAVVHCAMHHSPDESLDPIQQTAWDALCQARDDNDVAWQSMMLRCDMATQVLIASAQQKHHQNSWFDFIRNMGAGVSGALVGVVVAWSLFRGASAIIKHFFGSDEEDVSPVDFPFDPSDPNAGMDLFDGVPSDGEWHSLHYKFVDSEDSEHAKGGNRGKGKRAAIGHRPMAKQGAKGVIYRVPTYRGYCTLSGAEVDNQFKRYENFMKGGTKAESLNQMRKMQAAAIVKGVRDCPSQFYTADENRRYDSTHNIKGSEPPTFSMPHWAKDVHNVEMNLVSFFSNDFPNTIFGTGLCISDSCIITDAHVAADAHTVGSAVFTADPTYGFKILHLDKERDLAIVAPNRPLWNVKDISSMLMTRSELYEVQRVVAHNHVMVGGTPVSVYIDCGVCIADELTIPVSQNCAARDFSKQVGKVAIATRSDFCTPGDSGRPFFCWVKDRAGENRLKIYGLHSVARYAYNQYLLATVSVEDISCLDIPCSQRSDWDVFPDLDVPQSKSLIAPLVVTEQLSQHVRELDNDQGVLFWGEKSAAQVVGLLVNKQGHRMPIRSDCSSSKHLTSHASIVKEYSDLDVAPARTFQDIFDHSPDKIVPDARGVLHAANNRMKIFSTAKVDHSRYKNLKKTALRMAERLYNSYDSPRISILSESEILDGTDNVHSVRLDASAGPTLSTLFSVHKKSDVLERVGQGERLAWKETQQAKEVRSLYEDSWHQAKKGKRPFILGLCKRKDECLPLEKTHRPRIFTVRDLVGTLLEKKVLGRIQSLAVKYRDNCSAQIGCNFLIEFDRLFSRLARAGDQGISLDGSAFDLSVPFEALLAIKDLILELYRLGGETNPSILQGISSVLDTICVQYNVLDGNIIRMMGTVPSGMYATALVDSFLVELLLATALYELYDIGYDEFKDHGQMFCSGDDSIISYGDELAAKIDWQEVADHMWSRYNLKITPGNKEGQIGAVPIGQLEFVSRRFLKMEGHPSVILGGIKSSSLFKSLFFADISNPDEWEIALQGARSEVVAHGRDFYIRFEGLAKKIMAFYSRSWEFVSYEQIAQQVAEGVTDSSIAAQMYENSLYLFKEKTEVQVKKDPQVAKILKQINKVVMQRQWTPSLIKGAKAELRAGVLGESFRALCATKAEDIPSMYLSPTWRVTSPGGEVIDLPDRASPIWLWISANPVTEVPLLQTTFTALCTAIANEPSSRLDHHLKPQRRQTWKVAVALASGLLEGDLMQLRQHYLTVEPLLPPHLVTEVSTDQVVPIPQAKVLLDLQVPDLACSGRRRPRHQGTQTPPVSLPLEAVHQERRLRQHNLTQPEPAPRQNREITPSTTDRHHLTDPGFLLTAMDTPASQRSRLQRKALLARLARQSLAPKPQLPPSPEAERRGLQRKPTPPGSMSLEESTSPSGHTSDCQTDKVWISLPLNALGNSPSSRKLRQLCRMKLTMIGSTDESSGDSSDVACSAPTAAPPPGMPDSASVAVGDANRTMGPLAQTDTTPNEMVLSTPRGVEAVGLIAGGFSADIKELAYKNQRLKSSIIQTNIVTGAVIDSLVLDPWDPNFVGENIFPWAALHSSFAGSFRVTISTQAASTIYGSVRVAYVPFSGGKFDVSSGTVSIQALSKYRYFDVNLQTGGTVSIEMTPTTDRLLYIERSDNMPFMGQLIMVASSDIGNAFGTTVPIPWTVDIRLSEDAHYVTPLHALSVAKGDSLPGGGELIDFPRLNAPGINIVHDGRRIPEYIEAEITRAGRNLQPLEFDTNFNYAKAGESSQPVVWKNENANRHFLGYHWGPLPRVDKARLAWGISSASANEDDIDDPPTVSRPNFTNTTAQFIGGEPGDIVRPDDIAYGWGRGWDQDSPPQPGEALDGVHIVNSDYNLPGWSNTITVTGNMQNGLYKTDEGFIPPLGLTIWAGGIDEITPGAHPFPTDLISIRRNSDSTVVSNWIPGNGWHRYNPDRTVIPKPIREVYWPAPGPNLFMTSSFTGGDFNPSGITRAEPYPLNYPVPGVTAAAASGTGHTLPGTFMWGNFYKEAMTALGGAPSAIITLNRPTGEYYCDFLFNKYGLWIPSVLEYGVHAGVTFSFLQQTVQKSAVEWPDIRRPSDTVNIVSRLLTAGMFLKDTKSEQHHYAIIPHTRLLGDVAHSAGAVATGGIFGSFNAWRDRAHESKMFDKKADLAKDLQKRDFGFGVGSTLATGWVDSKLEKQRHNQNLGMLRAERGMDTTMMNAGRG